MTQKRISKAEWEALFAELGMKPAPPDHPIYSEGPSIQFLSRTQKPSEQKAIVSPQSDMANDSD